MRAEIIAVGTEIVLGDIQDENSRYVSRRAAALGIDVYHHVAVGDNPGRMREAFQQALSRADVVVTSGGLGPTDDDLTKEVMAEVLGRPLVFDAGVMTEIEEFFRRRGRFPTGTNRKQAMVPEGATVLRNRVGTAPGIMLDTGSQLVLLLPGPPSEFCPMWEEQVEPILRERGAGRQVIFSHTLKVCGLGESAVADKVRDLFASANPTLAPYAKMGEVHLRLTCRAGSREEAEEMMAPLEAEVCRRLGWRVFGRDITLEAAVGEKLVARGLSLGVAESCTAGMLGARITTVPGSSRYFLGGVIAYADRVKEGLLGVSPATLASHGAVSEMVVRAMAEGARGQLAVDLALAVSGVAGPGGGTADKPVGTVWLALAAPDGVWAWREWFSGGREEVRYRSCQSALTGLYEYLATGGVGKEKP